MPKRQILVNAIMSLGQVVVISGVLFFLYRFLLKVIGVEQLGIWSLVLATTAITQLATFGLSGSVVKFVAKYVARQEEDRVSGIIQTAALSLGAALFFALLLVYPIGRWLLALVIAGKPLQMALQILPYALLNLWVVMIAGVFQAGLDGFQRIDLRSLLLMGSSIMHLLLCLLLAPAYGLIGVAYARISESFLILLGSWFVLRRILPNLPLVPRRWDRLLFKEMIGYGLKFQVLTATSMFFEPTTKALLGKFGGLSMVGFYEMASKMVQQFRGLVVAASQVIVPAIAGLQEKFPEKVRSVYLKSYRLLFFLMVPLFSLLIVFTPSISRIWIGHPEKTFMTFAILLSAGWFLNTLDVPAYFAYLGIGNLRWNLYSQITIALLNLGVGILLGKALGGIGVVLAWGGALALGGSLVYLSYHHTYGIPLFELWPEASRKLSLACIGAMFLYYLVRHFAVPVRTNAYWEVGFLLAASSIILLPAWANPQRKQWVEWVSRELFAKSVKGT
jgi:O-antigen/teichoic acid export membrane protein